MAAARKAGSADKAVENPPKQAARRWKRELDLAGKREKDWREAAEKIVKRYRGEERKKSRFNVLWSNTEILRPAIYNSRPNPDVRRRFRDADPVGKAVSEILERCLNVEVDGYEFDCAVRNDVLDSLLPGRGVTRIRYIASIRQTGGEAAETAEQDAAREATDTEEGGTKAEDATGAEASDTNEAEEGASEELEYERVAFEHVDWRDYREGFAQTWEEVPWIGFRCKLTADESGKMFGADAVKDVKFTEQQTDDDSGRGDPETSDTEKTAEFWEIWDKPGRRRFFLQEKVDVLLFPTETPNGEPPLDLVGFYPIPDPLRMIENTSAGRNSARIPVPHFSLYQEQAEEVDRLSARIQKITEGLKLRGVYDSKLPEMADLMDSQDNQLTPIQNAQGWAQNGGLEGAITWLPIEPAAKVLTQLYEGRVQAKAVIDEITGISDIIRGATAASETATAQQIKANFASVRLQRMQKEVQRYCRDLLRLAAEVMADKFGQDTFARMSELQLPTAQQKQQMIAQAMMQAKQTGQPPNPQQMEALQKVPSWDDVMAVMRSDSVRGFKIDVETDSTVAGTLESDMQGLSQVLQAVGQALTEMTPLVQAGALPIDAAKEIVLAVVRRARLGIAVEDAFDKLQAPKPPQQPPDTSLQQAQVREQGNTQRQQMQQQHDAQIEQMRQQAETQRQQMQDQAETQRQVILAQVDKRMASADAKLDAAVRLIVAQITALKQADAATAEAERTYAANGAA